MLGVGDLGRRAGDLHDGLQSLDQGATSGERATSKAKPVTSASGSAQARRAPCPASSHELSGIPRPLAAIVGRDWLKKRCGSRRRTMVEAWAARQHWRKAGRQGRGACLRLLPIRDFRIACRSAVPVPSGRSFCPRCRDASDLDRPDFAIDPICRALHGEDDRGRRRQPRKRRARWLAQPAGTHPEVPDFAIGVRIG